MKAPLILNLIPLAFSVKSLRKNQLAGSGPYGTAPVISPLSLNPINAPDSYTGVTVRYMPKYHVNQSLV